MSMNMTRSEPSNIFLADRLMFSNLKILTATPVGVLSKKREEGGSEMEKSISRGVDDDVSPSRRTLESSERPNTVSPTL